MAQCDAAERLRERFGLPTAMDYLLAEKLHDFIYYMNWNDPESVADLEAFLAEVRRLFTEAEIREFLTHPERSKRTSLRRIFARLKRVLLPKNGRLPTSL